MMSAANPGVRASFIEDVQRCVIAMIIIVLTPVFIKVLIAINDGFVALFANVVNSVSVPEITETKIDGGTGMFVQILAAPFQVILNIVRDIFGLSTLDQLIFNDKVHILKPFVLADAGNEFATVLLNLSFAGFDVYFNAIYTIRHWVIIVTLVSTPLIAWIWVLTTNAQVLEIWAGEIFETIFMQTAHALTFGVFISILCGVPPGSSPDVSWLSGGLKDVAVWFAGIGGAVCTLVIVFIGHRFITASDERARSEAIQSLIKALAGLLILGLATLIAGFLAQIFSGRWY